MFLEVNIYHAKVASDELSRTFKILMLPLSKNRRSITKLKDSLQIHDNNHIHPREYLLKNNYQLQNFVNVIWVKEVISASAYLLGDAPEAPYKITTEKRNLNFARNNLFWADHGIWELPAQILEVWRIFNDEKEFRYLSNLCHT